ncbi:hypothetical protein LAUMK191_02396 [Mycobacterium attenuatum]|uniref:Uncharacterized protein n=1 Tax=Mycobacterium kansasii TaxID=1768 RepID=A0A1V3WRZ1_MYCKA|nr:hypothetical protein BZL29_6172 [Mycobacterium kansasii]VBA52207.1 hypothetical protein LAUMK191_02396 [Mycobacterium attenuatum]
MIDLPTFSAGIVISGPKPTPRMVFGVAAQPGPQAGIGVLGSLGGGFVALGGPMLPGHAAGEPFADPQHTLEVTNGCPPTLRA